MLGRCRMHGDTGLNPIHSLKYAHTHLRYFYCLFLFFNLTLKEHFPLTICSATIRIIQSTCGSVPSHQPQLTHLCPPVFKAPLSTHSLQEHALPQASVVIPRPMLFWPSFCLSAPCRVPLPSFGC